MCIKKNIILAAFRTPGFLGTNGSFGFANFSSFDQCENNGLNFSHGFRHNKSPVSLYLNNSNSPSANHNNHCENGDNFSYQNNHNNNNNNIQLNNKNIDNSGHKNNYNNNNSGEVNSRGNSPRENYNSNRADSPDKRADTCSPEETSRSFSSHRNDDIGSRSPINHHNNDSLGSQSPENLSSSKSLSSSKKNNNNNINHSDMLDHKLQLSFLGPPLAALHSMTENSIMKSQNSPQTSQNSQCPTNPHGIDSILSRPTPVTSAHLNAALGGKKVFLKWKITNKFNI